MPPALLSPPARRHSQLIGMTDVIGRRVASVFRSAWYAVVRAIRGITGWWNAFGAAKAAARVVVPILSRVDDLMDNGLQRIGRLAHRNATQAIDLSVRRAITRIGPDWLHGNRAEPLTTRLARSPDESTLRQIIYGRHWERRGTIQSRHFSPQTVADTVFRGVSAGHTLDRIAADLETQGHKAGSAARRLARTEGLRVAHEVQLRAWSEWDDYIIGYQIHAVLDERSRPEHAERDKTIYYKRPGPGQKSILEMPHPPYEADGRVAWNCRCVLSPVFGG